MNKNLSDIMLRLGEAAAEAASAFVKLAAVVVEALPWVTPDVLQGAQPGLALVGASPRVRHLALHGRKYRTRKKNLHRALREYERRRKNGEV